MSLASYVAAELSWLRRQEGRRAVFDQTVRNRGQAAVVVVDVRNDGKSLEWQRLA